MDEKPAKSVLNRAIFLMNYLVFVYFFISTISWRAMAGLWRVMEPLKFLWLQCREWWWWFFHSAHTIIVVITKKQWQTRQNSARKGQQMRRWREMVTVMIETFYYYDFLSDDTGRVLNKSTPTQSVTDNSEKNRNTC